MKKNSYYRKLIVGIIILFVGMSIAPGITNTLADDSFETHVETIEFIQEFSKPIIRENEEFVEIIVEEANSCMAYEKKPMMPFLSKTYEFPLGTKLINVEITPSKIKTMAIGKQVKPAPPKQRISHRMSTVEKTINQEIYSNSEPYPNEWCSYTTGAGLSKDNDHVLFLSLHLYPTRYLPLENSIQYVEQIMVSIIYEEPEMKPANFNGYNLVIISPSEFSNNLQQLVDHKNSYNIDTNLVTLDDIYGEFPGRDDAEQIKYFIKHAIEEWDIEYVLLVGDIKKLPIRTTYASQWEPDLLSDLYYADIYDENYSFCNWDGNNNSKFGEVRYTQHHVYDLDDVDLYPDVNLGRLACRNQFEISTVVDKIVNYETRAYGEEWFNRLVLCGGDTFPGWNGIEGEVTNDVVAQNMPDFTPIRLWASTGTFNWISVNREINAGAGFLDYSGHGFEIGLGTHPPNDEKWLRYRDRHLLGLFNRYKLPVIFFDACLTAKLDFDISGVIEYLPGNIPDFSGRFGSILVPTFAWNWVRKPLGGAIATIGATRSAYTHVDEHGVYGGAGFLGVNFFKAYEEGTTVSQMLTQSQNDYINEAWKDFFTLEEFVLLGDPSLKVGGYPPN